MFMICEYNALGIRKWLDDGFIWENVEDVDKRLKKAKDDAVFGMINTTYLVVPINNEDKNNVKFLFDESYMHTLMPMLDKEVEISDIVFKDNHRGFTVSGDKSISSFLFAWAEKHANDLKFGTYSIESSMADGDILIIIVKEVKSIEP